MDVWLLTDFADDSLKMHQTGFSICDYINAKNLNENHLNLVYFVFNQFFFFFWSICRKENESDSIPFTLKCSVTTSCDVYMTQLYQLISSIAMLRGWIGLLLLRNK